MAKKKSFKTQEIWVLGQRWTIEFTVGLPGGCAGCCDVDQCTIQIDASLAPESQSETLMHEILHALIYVAGLHTLLGPYLEEEVCWRLSPLLLAVLRTNNMRFDK